MPDRNYSGNPYQNTVQLRTNATRKTEEQPRTRQQTARQHYRIDDDGENDDAWTMLKSHTSALRYDRPAPKRTALLDDPKKTRRIQQRRLDRSTLIIIVSLIIIVMVGGWWLLSTVSTWWTNWQDDLHYGNPRTFQVDRFVGQGDSPDHPDHFIAVNIHGRVVVIQMNLQHPELDQTYGITTTDPTTPVSLTFRQMGSTIAMYVFVGTTAPYTVELVSNGTKFVSPH
jgi:hypothetical protein